MKTANSFYTESYKNGFVHTWVTAEGKNKAQAQVGTETKEYPTVIGCKRWITSKQVKTTTFSYTLPTWAIGPIEYGDYSSLDDTEEEQLARFLATVDHAIKSENGSHGTWNWPHDIDEAKYFAHSNDIDSLGADVVEVDLVVFINQGVNA